MTELRVPTTSLPVEVRCADGTALRGDIFLPTQSSRQPGRMRPDEWSDTTHGFFPFRQRDTAATSIVNRDAVVAITVPAAANTGDDVGGVTDTLVVRVAVEAAGEHFEGEVVIDMPPEHSRVADWLNAPGTFITVRDGLVHHLIQKRHVTRVLELGGAR